MSDFKLLETGWRSAVIYTLIENYCILGHNPYAYLKWVFDKLPSATNQDDLGQFLPHAWADQCKKGSQHTEASAD